MSSTASCVAIVIANVTSASTSAINTASSSSTTFHLRRCGSHHLQTRRRQQRMGAADAMVKSCSGERLKKIYFSPNCT